MMQKNQSLRFGIIFAMLVLAFLAVGALNACTGSIAITPKEVLRGVREAVDSFVKEAEQFDDLTMLCLEYKGGKKT